MQTTKQLYAGLVGNIRRSPEVLRCARLSPDWVSLTSTYVLRRDSIPDTFRTRSGDVVRLEQFTDLVTAWVIYCRREYTVRPDDRVIVDAGANIGVFSLYAARTAPSARIVAVEPFPETRRRLEQTIAANGLGQRVVIRDCALAKTDSTRMMDGGSGDGPSQSRGMLPPDAADGVQVPAVSLGTLFEREGLRHVDLLKMDIEGGEHEVLAGVSRDVFDRIDRISLEYHPNGPKTEIFARLVDAGFGVTRDQPAGVNSGVAEFSRRPS